MGKANTLFLCLVNSILKLDTTVFSLTIDQENYMFKLKVCGKKEKTVKLMGTVTLFNCENIT